MRALPCFLKLQAGTVHMQLMMLNFLTQDLASILQDGVETRVTKFLDTTAIGTEQMVSLATAVALFVVGSKTTKLMMLDQTAFQEQFQGIVNRRPRNAMSQGAQILQQGVGRKRAIHGINPMQDIQPFGGWPQASFAQKAPKNIFDRIQH